MPRGNPKSPSSQLSGALGYQSPTDAAGNPAGMQQASTMAFYMSLRQGHIESGERRLDLVLALRNPFGDGHPDDVGSMSK